MTDIDSARRDPPADWREKLIGVLTADGISELPKVPRWKRFFIVLGKAVGWVLVAFFINLAIVLVAIWIAAYPIYVLYPHDQFDSHMNKVVTVSGWAAFIFVVWFVFPRLRRILREAVQVSLGYQPTDVLKRAKHAPVLFLRSFKFDSITSSVPTWQERLPIGTFAMPTSELNLVQMIFRHAPVIAIGRPGEFTPPNGAVRFYARQDVWQQTVQALVPLCQLIVWTTGHTEGLRWEIKHLLESAPPQKLLLWLHVNIGSWKKAERDSEWAKFREAYKDVFPRSCRLTLRACDLSPSRTTGALSRSLARDIVRRSGN